MEIKGKEERSQQFYGASACLCSAQCHLPEAWDVVSPQYILNKGLISSVQNRKCGFQAEEGKGDGVAPSICFPSSFLGDFSPAELLKAAPSLLSGPCFPNPIKQIGTRHLKTNKQETETVQDNTFTLAALLHEVGTRKVENAIKKKTLRVRCVTRWGKDVKKKKNPGCF